MEFKKRLVRKRKARQVTKRKGDGWVRVTIRGRKRWIKGKPAEDNA